MTIRTEPLADPAAAEAVLRVLRGDLDDGAFARRLAAAVMERGPSAPRSWRNRVGVRIARVSTAARARARQRRSPPAASVPCTVAEVAPGASSMRVGAWLWGVGLGTGVGRRSDRCRRWCPLTTQVNGTRMRPERVILGAMKR